MSHTENLHLALRMKQGDERALTIFMNKHRGWIYKRAISHLKNAEDAEEVVGDIFLLIYQACQRWDEQEQGFATYFNKIVHTKIIDKHRKQQRKKQIHTISLDDPDHAIPADEMRVYPDPLEIVVSDDNYARILDAIVGIKSPKQRLAFILKYIEGYTNDEIAEIMGMTVGSIKISYIRARHHLQQQLQESR